MSTAVIERPIPADDWLFGALGGLVGGVAFGVVLQTLFPRSITTVVPALYGIGDPSLAVGWAILLAGSVVFGLLYAVVANAAPIAKRTERIRTGAVAGTIYGVALWAVNWAVLLPLWLSAIGAPGAPPIPNFNLFALSGHVLYGFLLGIVYTASWEGDRPAEHRSEE